MESYKPQDYKPFGSTLTWGSRVGAKPPGRPVSPPPPDREYTRRIDALECHFRWRLGADMDKEAIDALISRLERHAEEEIYVRKPILALIAYLHTLGGYYPKSIAALDRADRILAEGDDVTCSFVLRANRLHALYIIGKEDRSILSKLETAWRNKAEGPKMEAEIWGTKGIAMRWFSRDKYPEAMAEFTKARVLDEKNPHWSYGEALMRRLIREGKVAPNSQADVESLVTAEKCLSKAVGLTEEKYPLYVAEHALCLAEYHQTYLSQSGQIEEGLAQRAESMADTARAHARGRQEVYRLCAATYRSLGLLHQQKNCLEEGTVKCDPNYDLLHSLGTVYANSRSRLDREKAVTLFGLAMKRSPYPGHARANLDLLRINALMDIHSRLGQQLLELEKKFPLSGMDNKYKKDFADLRSLIMFRLKVQTNQRDIDF